MLKHCKHDNLFLQSPFTPPQYIRHLRCYKIRQTENERGTANVTTLTTDAPPTISVNVLAAGLQYALTRQHLLRSELNFTLDDLKLNNALIKIGYQYRFWQ